MAKSFVNVNTMSTVMIIAGESSGELYGSLLARSLKRALPDVRLLGVGGERMREAGVELIARTSDAFGLTEAVSAYGKIREAFRRTVKALREHRPEVLVLIDYPDFNLKVGSIASSLGIRILYYVSPQIWAWRKGRIKKIARLVDRMAVILPFEEDIYRTAGVSCEFVGHPILEEISAVLGKESFGTQDSLFGESFTMNPKIRAESRSLLGLDPETPILSLLPGSRPSELTRHLPLLLNVVRKFKTDPATAHYRLCMPLSSNTDEGKYASWLSGFRDEGVHIHKGETVRTLAASDIAVVASGTATLQTALLEVPMVVIYKLSPLTYQLGKLILDVRHISLVNILSGREVVTELIQERADTETIMRELKKIISDTKYREGMRENLRNVREPFLGKNPSERVAGMVIELAGGG